MRSTILTIVLITVVWFAGCSGKNSESAKLSQADTASVLPTTDSDNNAALNNNTGSGEVVVLNKTGFLEKVYDFEQNPNKWEFKGTKPCIIDFYADWCRPCKMVAPIMADFAQLYEGKIDIYKVNTDHERELAQFFGIRSIPSVLFVPVGAEPQMMTGAYPKEQYLEIINNFLLKTSSN